MKYTDTHEWISEEGRVGISKRALEELGEIVYIELPKVGSTVQEGDEIAVLESTKAAADIYSPASGRVIRINPILESNLSSLNTDPEGEGWLFELEKS